MRLKFVSPTFFAATAVVGLGLIGCSSSDDETGSNGQSLSEDASLSEVISGASGSDEYQVTYDSLDAEGTKGRYTIAVKGEKTYAAFDFDSSSLGGSGFESISIDDGTSSYTCGDPLGIAGQGSEPSEVCYGSPSGQGESDLPSLRDLFDPAGLVAGLANAGAETGPDGSEEIAGQEARCFKVEEQNIGKGRLCVHLELGIPLLLEGTDPEGARYSSRATEVKGEVDDATFEPPFEVKDYPIPSG
jgi:hypothetical protein